MKKYLLILIIATLIVFPGCLKKNSNEQNTTPNQTEDNSSLIKNELPENTTTNSNESPETNNNDEPIIGGETDEYGCLIAAGYSWCQPKQKCLRIWEEKCTENIPEPTTQEDFSDAGEIALKYFQETDEYQAGGKNLNIQIINQNQCSGCWTVEVQYQKTIANEEQVISREITIENWQVKE